jgi:hypothetical protein
LSLLSGAKLIEKYPLDLLAYFEGFLISGEIK